MSRLIIGILSGVGGLIIGGFGGRKTSNITMEDVKAAPGKAMSAVSGIVKKTGQKIGSGFSSLAFWKRKGMKKEKVNLEKNYRELEEKLRDTNEEYAKLSEDFSTAVKRKDIVEADLADKEADLADKEEQLKQAKEMNTTWENTVDEKDEKLRQAALDKKKVSDDLKLAQLTLKKQAEQSTPEN